MSKLTAERLVEDYSAEERAMLERVEEILPALAARSGDMDQNSYLSPDNVKTLGDAGLLGLVVPKDYGGLGGGLRVWAGACFAIGTVCPSTALAYFFHLTSASRGNLSLKALDAGLFNDEEAPRVRAFAEKILYGMGRDRLWLANFASESVKSEAAAITITTKAAKVEGGWELNGVKSFGCATGIANRYLVAASLEGINDASGLCTFLVDRGAPGTRGRIEWNALGMRGSATEGLVLENVFVAADDALAIPGAFVRMCSQSRSGYVGNQVAASQHLPRRRLRRLPSGPEEHAGAEVRGHRPAPGHRTLPTAVDRRHVCGPEHRHPLGAPHDRNRDRRTSHPAQGGGHALLAHLQGAGGGAQLQGRLKRR